MKRCCRYVVELTIFQLSTGDRMFKLLQLGFFIQHICLELLSPLSGSELLQISERLPKLKSLVIRNCCFVSLIFFPFYILKFIFQHFKFARDFQRMLNGFEQLQVLSVTNCENFGNIMIILFFKLNNFYFFKQKCLNLKIFLRLL
jgi:hypothetical protein